MLKQSVSHTLHCLLGCSIGEILGMVAGSRLSNATQTAISVALAFFFGYLLTFWSAKRKGMENNKSVKIALASDTASITSMEIADNAFIWLIPGAIHATLSDGLFWWSLAASLAVAFAITVPVNYFLMSREGDHVHHH